MTKIAFTGTSLLIVALAVVVHPQQHQANSGSAGGTALPIATLAPTDHPRLPRDSNLLWFVPQRGAARGRAGSAEVEAIKLAGQGNYEKALPALLAPGVEQGPFGDYALYYAGVAQLHSARPAEARRLFQKLAARPLVGYLVEAAAVGEGEADEALNEPRAAFEIYERLVKAKIGDPDDMLMRLGRAAKASGNLTAATEAFARVYYEFPLSDMSLAAGLELTRLPERQSLGSPERFRQEVQRAERLFTARQYGASRTAFEALRAVAPPEQRELVALRVAECDYFLKRAKSAREVFRRYSAEASRQAEAIYFYALASNETGDKGEYRKSVDRLREQFPGQSWTAAALDHLATQYILQDEDDAADRIFRELYERFPKGQYSERAAWKIGWRAFRQQNYEDTVRVFERAAADFPRSDYRPSWLYWAGRARELLGERVTAQQLYQLAATDYLNSYYGHLAATRLEGFAPLVRVVAAPDVQGTDPRFSPPPPNAAVIRRLLEVQLYTDALNELRFAERAGGSAPQIQATIAWVHQQQGQAENGSRRFTLVRGAITAMRRAYPQFMAAGGEELPSEILGVIFPLSYWDLIRKYSAQHDLDPYLVAALVAQESTFVPDIKSYANAVGLMQLMSFTARQYAKKLSLRYSPAALTNPETNIRLGTAYFADKVKEFGGDVHLALASYNAGEGAVHRWLSERPGVPRDEFIDDIPYPQTQNYVKRILGTAEDYRRLYSAQAHVNELAPAVKVATVAQGVGAPPSNPEAKKRPATKRAATKPSVKKKSRKTA